MKLTKKLEAEILKAYNDVWDAYLRGDMRTFASALDENCYIIGSAAGEVFSNKKAAIKYYKSTAAQITGKAEFRNRKIKVMPVENGVMVNEKADFYLLIDDQWTFYGPARISSLFHKKNNKWKVIHQHGSFPHSKTEEGEQVNTDKIKAENIQLRDAVKRRTEELENKNRELEIESSLEKVRAQALGMYKPDDLLNVCKVLFKELSLLGFNDIRNAIIHTYNDEENYFIDYDYSDLTGGSITNISYNSHPVIKRFLKQIRSDEAFAEITIKGKELNEWKKFRKSGGQPDDPGLDKTSALYYYFHSVGTGDIGISTFSSINEEKLQLLKRFRNVFELAYKRYTDITKAEAQAREAQIETGLERVRSKTMAMHKSEEVTGIAVSLNEELLKLGFEGGSTIMIIDKETGDTEQWTGFSEDKNLKSCYVPYFKHSYHDALLNNWKREEKFLVYTLSGEEKKTIDEHYFATGYKDFPESDKKWMREMGTVTFSHAFMKYGAIHWGPDHLTEEQLKILQRFSKVFEQSYTRFLDLQKAEDQAREAKIEAALERVRSRSMAMHKSDDLHEVIKVVVEQLSVLSVKFNVSNFAKIDPDGSWDLWLSTPEQAYPALIHVPYIDHPIFSRITEEGTKGNDFFTDVYTRKEANIFFHHFFENTIAKNTPEERKQFVYNSNGFTRSIFLTKNIWFSVARYDIIAFTDEENAIFKRFANVFEQAYTRFLDLQKAEAQARETEIELSLERVRAKTMAMQKPSEFVDVITVIGEQFVHLGFDIDWANFGASGFAITEGIDIWNFAVIPGASPISARVFIPYFDHPVFTTSAATINEFTNGGKDFTTVTLDKQTKDKWLDHLFTKTIFKDVPGEYRVIQYAKPGYTTSNISIKDTWLSIGKFDIKNFTDEQHAILRRFANAFGQAYTRFLDLQKAEAQAKEAQIEAALERVRARSMAMHHSSELHAAADVLFQQLRIFGGDIMNAGIALCTQDADEDEYWLSSDSGLRPVISIPHTEDSVQKKLYEDWKNKSEFFSIAKGGDELKAHYNYMQSVPSLKPFFKEGPDWSFPTWQKWHAAYFSHGYLFMITLKPYEEEKILVRFAKVFEQAYTRFLDLQKAEAQAREAQIEASLERVRSRAMAMQTSEELRELIGTVFTELTKLDLVLTRCLIMIYDPRSNDSTWWMANSEAPTEPIGLFVQYHEYPTYLAYVKAWHERNIKWQYILEGKAKKEWDHFLFAETELSHLPDFVIAGMKAPNRVYLNSSFNSFGNLTLATLELLPDEHFDIMLRFAKVFDLTYTRFNDLKQAEAQAKEAKIEAALERVRARSMGMQKSDELAEVVAVLYKQFAELDFGLYQVLVSIYDKKKNQIEWWSRGLGEIELPQCNIIPVIDHPFSNDLFEKWENEVEYYPHILEGELKQSWEEYLFTQTDLKKFPQEVKDMMRGFDKVYLSDVFMKYGSLQAAGPAPLPDEKATILKRFVKVLDHAYTRMKDLQNAEAQTREAQIELALERVRARTMAMHKSEELAETAQVLFHQLSELGGIPDRIAIGVVDEEKGVVNFWTTDQQGSHLDHSFSARLNERTTIAKTYQAWKEQKRSLVVDLHGEELKEWIQFAREEMGIAVKSDQIKDRRVHNFAFFSHGWILVTSHEPQSAETIQILERFASVFNLTYRRFLDLQKAEAQAKEAQIESALEKVRSRSLAMHKSDELQEVVNTVFERLMDLGIEADSSNIAIFKEGTRNYDYWIASPAQKRSASFHMPYTNLSLTRDLIAARESGKEFSTTAYSFEEKNEWFEYAFKNTDFKFLSEERKQFILNSPGITVAIAFSKNTGVQVNRYSKKLLSEGEAEILKRFSKVFEQAYIRFVDLEKAEAQAREAQIEASLERVRSKTMAMHKSDELLDIIIVVSEQLQQLNIKFGNVSFGVNNQNYDLQLWMAVKGYPQAYHIHWTFLDNPGVTRLKEAQQQPEKVYADVLTQAENNEWLQHIFTCNPAMDIFSDEARNKLLNSPGYARSIAVMKDIFIVMGNYAAIPYSDDENAILKRFANVFEQAYKRFLDLQKAEAQAREAQIEASLERVRASAMAMHRSDELSNVLAILFEQFDVLKIQPVDVHLDLFDLEKNTFSYRATGKEGKRVIAEQIVDLDSRPEWKALLQKWKNGKPNTVDFSFYPKEVIRELMAFFPDIWAVMPEDAIMSPEDFPDGIFDALGYCKFGYIGFHHHRKATEEEQRILIRFANEFERLYQRFLDLQKAEAQAKEAHIEAALERVRSKTMAMHNSQDVGETVATMFDQLVKLGVTTNRCGILIFSDTNNTEVWTAKSNQNGEAALIIGHLDVTIHSMLQGVRNAWKNKETFFSYELAGENIRDYYSAINNYPDYPTRFNLDNLPAKEIHSDFFFPEGAVFAFTSVPISAEASQIFKRFAGVFGQTYRRYLDLQKAEANAREAQIEAGLERVRARTMAMHSSNDVGVATATMFTELEKLGIENLRGGITIIKPDQMQEVWSVTNMADGRTVRAIGVFDMKLHPLWRALLEGKEKKEEYLYYWMAGKDKEDYINILNATPNYLTQPIKEFPDVHVQSYFFGEGAVWTNSLEPHSEEDKQVMKRFASVFSLTFRRYQDLKKAEAQAREATIEAALEKVRGKAMAMHNSNDLTATASLVFTELRKLGISPMRCGVGMLNKENRKALLYAAIASEEGDNLSQIGWVLLDGNPVLKNIYDTWIHGEDYFPVLKKEMLKAYYEHLKSGFEVPEEQTEYEHHGYFLPFSEGVFYGWAEKPFTESEIKVLKRFASVIDLTFRRYIELQKSEANAREAVKQAALDRVRAEIASMRTINDLDRITPLIWNELTILGIPFIRCGVFIMDDEQELIHTFLSTPDGKAIAAFHLPYDTPGNLAHVVANWKKNKNYIDHWDEAEFIQFADILVKGGALVSAEQYLKTIPKGGFYLHFLPFLQGMLYVGNTDQLKEEEIELIQHVADAFSTAYARYEDFNKLEAAKQQVEKTLTDLKQAQTQLVQAEKMASLGELTAGIAHEIQNPLNFVNNFSEVSKELLDEMKTELETGNTEDAKDIADDVIQNLEKINHHGKRADAIVKSMLQHSRSSSGKKEPTDINALADEYLRLAYHGLRAKDKSFNAKFETTFDDSIGKINIISQDIGRVLVNLINNAFYAVSERKKQESNGYEPTVEVLTKKTGDKIEIKVKDNGNGIPQKVLDKIFQPFFTTKPTGQGTGLGLSLAYDIITKGHSGELKVETKEGEGSEFIIQLPNQSS